MRIDKNTLRGRIRNWVTALFLASFATLAGCNNEGRSQEVELRYWPSLRQQVYDFLFAGDNYVIRLHVYDDVTPLPSSTRSLVHSIGSVEFSVPKRAVMKNITSGSGDKDVLPLLFHSRNGVIEPLRAGRKYDEGRLLEVVVRSISAGMLDEYRQKIFRLRTNIDSLSSAQSRRAGFTCVRDDAECISRILGSSRGREEYCGMAIFTYDDGRGEKGEGKNLPDPLSAGNIFVPVSDLERPNGFVACDRNPRGAACLWSGLYKNTYPISISVGAEGICVAQKYSQEITRWLDQALTEESP